MKNRSKSVRNKKKHQDAASVAPSFDTSWCLFAIALAAALIWSYLPNVKEMYHLWQTQPDYSHGFLVPFLSIGMAWARRDLLPKMEKPSIAVGLTILVVALIVRHLAAKYFFTPIENWTMILALFGAICAVAGIKIAIWATPSILFLIFAMPMPYVLEVSLRQPLQLVAAKFSSIVLVILGIPAVAEANVIRIGGEVYGVNEACSGLRIFWGIAAFAFAILVFSRMSWIKKSLFVLGVLPVALLANSTRIIVTCILYENVGTEIAKKFSHDIAGIFMIPLAVVLLLALYQLLNYIMTEMAVSEESIFATAENAS